jgi:hypothetical protein
MRSVIIAAMSAFVTLGIVSIGYPQNDQGASQKPSDQSAVPTDRALAADPKKPTVGEEESIPGITPAQETKIPYHPCNTSVVLADGRNACLDNK